MTDLAEPIRVLVIEDNPGDVDLICELLPGAPAYAIHAVPRLADALAWLDGQPTDLLLVDLGLPDSSGLATFRAVRAASPATALIVLTGQDDDELALRAVAEGAQDWLPKAQVHGNVLERAARYALERTRNEAALRESLQRSRTLFEATPDALFVIDAQRRIREANQVAVDRYGYTRAELLSLPVDALSAEDLRDQVPARVAQARTEGARWEWRHRRRDGREFPVEIVAGPITLAGERCILASARDVSAHHAALGALRSSQERYRNLVENLDDVVFAVDMDGRVGFISSAVRAYGYAPEEVIGQPFARYVHPEDLPLAQANFEAALAGRPEPVEYRILNRDGRVRHVRGACRPVLEGGRPVGVAGVLIDLTARRLLEDQLRSAQKMEAVGRLAGGIAHDFNNLLSVIVGCVDFALDGLRDGDPLQEDLREVRRAADRAVGLTRQLLAFSRRQILAPRVISLNEIVQGLESMLRRLIGEDVELAVAPAPDLGNVKADPGQIEQVVLNLAVNARDAMPDGGRLTIETADVTLDGEYGAAHVGVAPGPYVRLSVSDTGCGMDEVTKGRIFEPFFTTKGEGKGTGLGLSTVYGIVRQSGGNVWVYSEPGAGTTFKVYFPRELTQVRTETRAPARPAVGGRETILLVEDDNALRRVSQRILEAAGYTVLAAANGGEALLLCERHEQPIHLLLTDVVMPRMSGRVLAERLLPLRPGLRVLFTSGYTENTIVHRGVLDEEMAFLGKPFSAPDLVRKVREVLDA